MKFEDPYLLGEINEELLREILSMDDPRKSRTLEELIFSTSYHSQARYVVECSREVMNHPDYLPDHLAFLALINIRRKMRKENQ